ncbi:MAG: hypothetical protein Q4G71_16390 [Pseudomonadota bacterium]|nr:hypothetical protein [Pseudomonadota bacterium]
MPPSTPKPHTPSHAPTGEAPRTAGGTPASSAWPLVCRNGVWVFDVPADAPRVTAEQVKSLLDDAP